MDKNAITNDLQIVLQLQVSVLRSPVAGSVGQLMSH